MSKDKVASLTGACEAFGAAPEYEVRGATRYDQDWIDDKIESGVGACHWARPKPRPAALDKPRAAAPAPAKKKAPLWKRAVKRLTS